MYYIEQFIFKLFLFTLFFFHYQLKFIGGSLHSYLVLAGTVFLIPYVVSAFQQPKISISWDYLFLAILMLFGIISFLLTFKNSSFIENYGRLGWIYQKILAEDALTNSTLIFWAFPSLIFHQISEENIKTF